MFRKHVDKNTNLTVNATVAVSVMFPHPQQTPSPTHLDFSKKRQCGVPDLRTRASGMGNDGLDIFRKMVGDVWCMRWETDG